MASPSSLVLSASSLKTSERSLVPSWTQSQEWLEKKCNLASFMMLESQLKASARLGLSEVNQMGVSCLLELDGPSCVACGEVSSIHVLPHGSGKECYLFGCGDHLVTEQRQAAADGCSSDWGVLVGVADGGDAGDCPNKMW